MYPDPSPSGSQPFGPAGGPPPSYPPPPGYYERLTQPPTAPAPPVSAEPQPWPGYDGGRDAGRSAKYGPPPPPPAPRPGLNGLLVSLVSAAVSLAIYYFFFQSWQLAIGIMALLFVHEMGHYVVIRAKGLPAGLPVFIPLAGAYVSLKRMPRDARHEAEIALAGPLAGGLAGLVCLGIGLYLGDNLFILLAYLNFWINLLNMIPIAPLDGSRVAGAITRWMWLLGVALVIFVVLVVPANFRLFALLLAVLGVPEAINRFRGAGVFRDYYGISALSRLYVAVLYIVLTAGLGAGLFITLLLNRGVTPF
jgi:Zn-dependent protease